MFPITPAVAATILNGLVEATAPAGEEPAAARAERERSLQAALVAFQPTDVQEMLLAAQILAGHFVAMARFHDATLQDAGSVRGSRLLRAAVTAQRMLLAATRALRLWRAAAAKSAAQQRKENRPAAGATGAWLPATATPQAAVTPVPPPQAAPHHGAAPPFGAVRPAMPPLAPPRADGRLPTRSAYAPADERRLAGPAPEAGGVSGYKAALRSSVALPAL